MASTPGGFKRFRKPNFSEQECIKLLEMIEANFDKIVRHGNSQTSNTIKRATWLHIASQVSTISTVERDDQECRKKWRDLRSQVTSFVAPIPGKEPPQQEPPYYEWIIKILGDSLQEKVSDAWENQYSEMQDGSEDLINAKTEQPGSPEDRMGSVSPESHGHGEEQGEHREEVTPSSSTGFQRRTTRQIHNSLISKAINKAKLKRRLAAQANGESDTKIWDEWLKVQIEYYKTKTELVKEQLLQLRGKQNENSE